MLVKLWNLLDGKKTYLVAAFVATLVFLHLSHVVDDVTYQTLLGLSGATGLVTLHMAIKN